MRTISLLALLAATPASMAALRGFNSAAISEQNYGSIKSFAPLCAKAVTTTAPIATEPELQAIATSVRDQINTLLEPMSDLEKGKFFANTFKLIFHDAAEADLRSDDQLGSDGCLSYTDGNLDLVAPTSIVSTVIEPMWQKYCDKMSRADFWVLFAKLTLEKADGSHSMNLPFQYGRKDAQTCGITTSRLMDNQRGEADFFRVFLQQMELSVNDAVVLMGARSVGYHNGTQLSWDETPTVLDNSYYKLLSRSSWINTMDKAKSRWVQIEPIPVPVATTAVDTATPVDTSTTLLGSLVTAVVRHLQLQPDVNSTTIVDTTPVLPSPSDFLVINSPVAMLNTDMALTYPIHTEFSYFYKTYVSRADDMCGPTMVDASTSHGCVGGGEEKIGWPYYTYDLVERYADSNSAFVWDFAGAFERLTTVGYNVAGRVIEEGKFGTLTPLPTITNAL